MREVYIVSAVRTPIGSFGGSLKSISATQLGAIAIQGAIQKSGIKPEWVDDVLMGCVLQGNLGQAPARQAAKFAGLPDTVNCSTINKVCASGMKAISLAAQSILLNDADIVIAGGMESMSNVPYYNTSARWGSKYGDVKLVDGLMKDALTDVYDGKVAGLAGELCAKECGISRVEQDAFAIESYQRAQAAWSDGRFVEEVIPVDVQQRGGSSAKFSRDEEPFNVKYEKIPLLNPVFEKNGTITAANASTMSDGAAALVLMSKEKAISLGIKPLARILSWADAEQSPEWFTTAPALAIPKAVAKAGLKVEDVDYWEINEAFSVVTMENTRRLKIDPAHVNVHGGAVSIGHPLGASGARIIVTLLHVLLNKQTKYGGAGICNGGGGASALILQNLQS